MTRSNSKSLLVGGTCVLAWTVFVRQCAGQDNLPNSSLRSGSNLSWDFRNRLVGQADPGTGVASRYQYDALGRRIEEARIGEEAETTRFVYDRWRELEEREEGGVTEASYVQGLYTDEYITTRRDGSDHYYHPDDLHSVAGVTDQAGSIAESYVYDDFGRPTVFDEHGGSLPQSAIGNPHLFTGRRLDAETALYYYRNRYLDAQAGRFISSDPLGTWKDSLNKGNAYTYVGNSPGKWMDPLGLVTMHCARGSVDVRLENCAELLTPEDYADFMPKLEVAICEGYEGVRRACGDIRAGRARPNRLNRWFGARAHEPDVSCAIGDTICGTHAGFTSGLTLRCEGSCERGGGAYTYGRTSSDKTIHLCPRAFGRSASALGSDIVHEAAHAYGGATDEGYYAGEDASSNPRYRMDGRDVDLLTQQLIQNADSYAGYIEQYYMNKLEIGPINIVNP